MSRLKNEHNIHTTLKTFFGYDAFRPGQESIINDVLSGKDVIALLPTGGGKSLCYQVPALHKDGVCIVISPLVALMKDQVEQLKKRGIPAVALTSGISFQDLDRLLDNVIYGDTKFLYLSPERLKSELVRERIKRMDVNLVAIDEAHCVSQWGYDFRPPYLEISEVRGWLPDTPFIALTASATPVVIEDLQDKLKLVKPSVHRKSFFRENLHLQVEWASNQEQRILDVLAKYPGTAIIYIRSRKQTTLIATRIAALGISAISYHAGLTREERDSRQAMWMAGDIRVMVATNAFGMGIDKPDVRCVIHLELPDGPESYYQEAGRAGRDGKESHAVMILRPDASTRLRERVASQIPDIEFTRRVYTALANQLQIPIGSGEGTFTGLDLQAFSHKYDLDLRKTFQSLQLLERYGLIRLSEGFKPKSTVHITMHSSALYAFEVQNPRFTRLLRQMLRWYGGIMSGHTGIDERALAAAIQLPGASVSKQLKALQSMQVLEYRPAMAGQGLEWMMARMESQYLPIHKKELIQLEKEAVERMKAMIYFAEHTTECRYVMLLDYFGEKSEECGLCDNCKARVQAAPSEGPDKAIMKLLAGHPMTLPQIQEQLGSYSIPILRKTMGMLLDEGWIERHPDGTYSKRSR